MTPSACSHALQRSSTSAVIVMQSTQDRQGEDLAIISICRARLTIPFWNLLPDSLMWPGLVEVVYIGSQYPVLATWDIRSNERPVVPHDGSFLAKVHEMGLQSIGSTLHVHSDHAPISKRRGSICSMCFPPSSDDSPSPFIYSNNALCLGSNRRRPAFCSARLPT